MVVGFTAALPKILAKPQAAGLGHASLAVSVSGRVYFWEGDTRGLFPYTHFAQAKFEVLRSVARMGKLLACAQHEAQVRLGIEHGRKCRYIYMCSLSLAKLVAEN
jgi:hypothetical protein